MTKEERELLLKDLCARVPYGVRFAYSRKMCGYRECMHPLHWVSDLGHIQYHTLHSNIRDNIEQIKPYLRPMSSMTKEEEIEYDATFETVYINGHYDSVMTYKSFDYLNSIHVDYRGLIEKGLALEAPEGMYEIVPSI